MSPSHDQVQRLLALVPYLNQRAVADLDETAREFGVKRRQLVKDLWLLTLCGAHGDMIDIDMDAVEGSGEIVLSNAGVLSRPHSFTPDEATTMLVALHSLGEIAPDEIRGSVQSVIDKLKTLTRESAVAIDIESGDGDVRETLAQAIDAQRAVQLTYQSPTSPKPTTPWVDPQSLVVREGYVYLQAFAHARDDWRTYRLDRIAHVEVSDTPVGDHGPAPQPDQSWAQALSEASIVTLAVKPSARWITEYYAVADVEKTESVWIVKLYVANPTWLQQLLLRLGNQVEVLDPVDAVESARQIARESLAMYARLK